jgi:hypothetical protein
MGNQKQTSIHLRLGNQDRLRLRRLMEFEEMTASALVRRLIRDRANELAPDQKSA